MKPHISTASQEPVDVEKIRRLLRSARCLAVPFGE